MSGKRKFLGAVAMVAQILVMYIIVSVAHGGLSARATGSLAVTGIVTDQNGNGTLLSMMTNLR